MNKLSHIAGSNWGMGRGVKNKKELVLRIGSDLLIYEQITSHSRKELCVRSGVKYRNIPLFAVFI